MKRTFAACSNFGMLVGIPFLKSEVIKLGNRGKSQSVDDQTESQESNIEICKITDLVHSRIEEKATSWMIGN